MYKLPKLGTESESTQRRQRKRFPGDRVTTALNRLCQVDGAENQSTRSANCVVTVIQFDSALYLMGDQLKEDGRQLSDWGSVIDVLVTITLETPVQSTENAKSTGVKITITGYCMQKKLADKERHHTEAQTE